MGPEKEALVTTSGEGGGRIGGLSEGPDPLRICTGAMATKGPGREPLMTKVWVGVLVTGA